jgi:hypothetical protein
MGYFEFGLIRDCEVAGSDLKNSLVTFVGFTAKGKQ